MDEISGLQNIPLNFIEVPPERRPIDEATVLGLMESIKRLGLISPIAARYFVGVPSEDDSTEDSYRLLVGRHRLEAVRRLGWKTIPCVVFKDINMSDDDARMWEISENLHRNNLTKEQRDEQIVEWAALAAKKESVGNFPTGKQHTGGSPSKGYSRTARDLGVDEKEVRDAHKLAELNPEVKQAAKDAGLSRTDTLKIARSEPAEQPSKVAQIAALRTQKQPRVAPDPLNDPEAMEAQVAGLMAAWNRAGPDARQEFMLRIDAPVFDSTRVGSA